MDQGLSVRPTRARFSDDATDLALLERIANGYQTLATAPAADAAQFDIVFAADTTAAEMQQLLDEIDGEIVAGPSTLGRYSVRISGAQPDAAQLAKLLETLGADPRVRFAGRALTEVEP